MQKCKLCNTNNADKTSSHIIPHFLLKRVDTEVGKTGRNKEVGFVIDGNSTTPYFGRSVLPEKLEELYGEITDEDLDNNDNIFVIDNIFCNSCEKRFAVIESEYAKSIDFFEKESYKNSISSLISFLFWTSILWRISINDKSGLVLKPTESNKLRKILDLCLKEQLEEISTLEIESIPEVNNLSYRLIRSPNYSRVNETLIFCHPKYKMPYFLIIDEYVLCFYFKQGHIDNLIQSCFGFEKKLKEAKINTFKTGEQIYVANDSEFGLSIKKVFSLIGSKRHDYFNWLFDEMHKKISNKEEPMPIKIKSQIFKNMSDSKIKLGRKYSQKNLFESIYNEMKKYAP